MLNATKTEIIIEMKHIDHAVKLHRFLEEVMKIGKYGGDLILSVEGSSENKGIIIGHDVSIRSVIHKIEKED